MMQQILSLGTWSVAVCGGVWWDERKEFISAKMELFGESQVKA